MIVFPAHLRLMVRVQVRHCTSEQRRAQIMNQEETAKADTQTEAIEDLEVTAKEGEDVKGAVVGGVIQTYMHVIRRSDVT